jgi:hypothetical protein
MFDQSVPKNPLGDARHISAQQYCMPSEVSKMLEIAESRLPRLRLSRSMLYYTIEKIGRGVEGSCDLLIRQTPGMASTTEASTVEI